MPSRKEIAEGVIARWRSRGVRIDEDPVFMELAGQWVRGEIEMDELRRLYLETRKPVARRHREDRPD